MLVLTPGPTHVPNLVRAAMGLQVTPHRSVTFTHLYEECATGLQRLARTSGQALAMAGSGTTAFESAQLSLVRPGDKVLCVSAGRFGERWRSFYTHADWLELHVLSIEHEWGAAIDLGRVRAELKANPDISVVTVVHSETSVASMIDLQAFCRVVRECAPDALLLADVVSSMGGAPMEMDEWGVDVAVCASQKCLGMPPGLGIVALGERAMERLREHRGHLPTSMDLRWHLAAHEELRPACTPPVSLFFGLREALHIIREEGLSQRQARVQKQAERTRATFTAMGLELFGSSPSPTVTAVKNPDGVGPNLLEACRRNHGVWLAGGQDQLSGRIFRIGHMGSVSDTQLISGLEAVIEELGRLAPHVVNVEAGLREARKGLGAAITHT